MPRGTVEGNRYSGRGKPAPRDIPEVKKTQETVAAPVAVTAEVTNGMKLLAKQFYEENSAANKHATSARQHRSALYKELVSKGVKSFILQIPASPIPHTLDVVVGCPESMVMDVRAIWKLLGLERMDQEWTKNIEKFFDVVSATKKSVVENLGTAAATRCEVMAIGEENVTVKPRK